MAHSIISRHVMRRLLLAVMVGGIAIAGVTQLATSTSTTEPSTASPARAHRPEPGHTPPTPRNTNADAAVAGAAGASISTRMSARAEGIAITGPERLAARPTVSTTTGTRLASEPTVQSRGDLVTATDVTLAAAVTNGHTSAHAFVRNARYGHHDLGSLAVHCRDGVPKADRNEVVQLTRNIQVRYGQANGNQITGASVLVLGPGDRVIRLVTIATVTCAAGSAATPTTRPSTQPPRPEGHPGAPERRLISRAPARPVVTVATGL